MNRHLRAFLFVCFVALTALSGAGITGMVLCPGVAGDVESARDCNRIFEAWARGGDLEFIDYRPCDRNKPDDLSVEACSLLGYVPAPMEPRP